MAADLGQNIGEKQTVFAAGLTDQDPVVGFNQVILDNGPPDSADVFFHFFASCFSIFPSGSQSQYFLGMNREASRIFLRTSMYCER